MASLLRVAFWNVQNLFEPGVVERGPQSVAELDTKLDRLAAAINQFFAGDGPDLLGLAEIQTLRIVRELASRLDGDPFLEAWEAAGISTQTGLAVLARQSRFSALQAVAVQRPTLLARPRAMIVQCELHGQREPFLLALNHWKSRLPSSSLSDADDRKQTADWLGQELSQSSRTTAALVIGDFNAEPFEAPFGDLRLRGRRTFSQTLWSGATPAYLYNTSWRFLPQPDPWETASQPAYRESRPKSSHGEGAPNMFDQLLVSGGALRGGLLRLLESQVEFVTVDQVTSRHTPSGVLVPASWRYVSDQEFTGASDHLPLTAVFEVL